MHNFLYFTYVLHFIHYTVQWKGYKWNHLKEFYLTITTPGNGLRLVPMLRYEHVDLTTFSKMCLYLASQENCSLPKRRKCKPPV